MKKRYLQSGFGILETLMSMLLVGVILGIVARGYQAMSRLNLATYQMSQRMELSAFLNRLSYEVVSALEITTTSTGFSFERINPTYNLIREQPASSRLPWSDGVPIPPPLGVNKVDLLKSTYWVSISYQFLPAENKIVRTSYAQTTDAVVNVGQFTVNLESGGRILSVETRPKEMTAPVKARILLPVVIP